MEYILTCRPPMNGQCQPPGPGDVRCSLAIHPTHGLALLTCFHGVAIMAQNRPGGNNHQAYVCVNGVGFAVNVLAADQPRDVAWLSWPANVPAPQALARNVELNPPTPGEWVVVFSAHGNFLHLVVDLPPRDPVPGSPPELQLRPAPLTGADQQTLDRISRLSFDPGQSGSPIIKLNNTVVGVVRNNEGRCGLLQL